MRSLITIFTFILCSCNHTESIDTSVDLHTFAWNNGYEGEVLVLREGGKFKYSRFSDAERVGYESYYLGKYSETDSTIMLEVSHFVEKSNNQKMNGFVGTKTKQIGKIAYPGAQFDKHLYKVNWQERLYLIRKPNLIHFVSDLNALIEPRYGSFQRFLIETSGRETKVTAFPELPEPFNSILDTTWVSGEIMEVLSDTTVLLKFTGDGKVHPGLWFKSYFLFFEIQKVQGEWAEALVYEPSYYPHSIILDLSFWNRIDVGLRPGVQVFNRKER